MFALALGPAILPVVGCMSVPERYRQPQATYAPRIERVTVAGFDREVFRQTAGGSATAIWGGHANSSANVNGPGVTGTATGAASWGGTAGSQSWAGEYRPVSDVAAFKDFLENTRCIRIVESRVPQDGQTLTLVGDTAGEKHTGVALALTNAPQVLTLVGALGVPVHEGADGLARVRVYQGEQFVRELRASARLLFWTTVYTFHQDEPQAVEIVRQMALRDLADEVAADLCR